MTPVAATPAALPPGYTLIREFGRDVQTMPGVEYVMWLGNDPAGAHVVYEDAQLLQLGRGVLRDTIGAAHLVLELDDDVSPELPSTPPGRTPWWEGRANLFRAVAAMPGVQRYAYDGESGVVTFTTDTAANAEHLAQLVRPDVGRAATRFVPSES